MRIMAVHGDRAGSKAGLMWAFVRSGDTQVPP